MTIIPITTLKVSKFFLLVMNEARKLSKNMNAKIQKSVLQPKRKKITLKMKKLIEASQTSQDLLL